MAVDQSKYIYLVYGLVVLYAVCYQLQAPLEPFLVDKLMGKDKSAEATVSYGRLQSFFQVVQTVGSLTFGNLIDRAGVRVGFIVNFVACAMTYLILANTSSLEMLYLSKVPGVGMAGFLCAQTAVSQLTPEGEERVAALGRLTTAYTIGGVIGPYTGGLLGSTGNYFLSAKIAAAASLLAAVLSCFLPLGDRSNVVDDSSKGDKKADDSVSAQLPWVERAKMVLRIAGFLTFTKLVTSTANSMASSSQSTILKNQLGFTEADLGFFMSSQFAFGGFANGFLLAPVTRFLGGKAQTVVQNCIAVMGTGYFAQAVLSNEYLGLGAAVQSRSQMFVFIGIAMVLAIFQFSLGTSITAESTQLVPKDMKGTLIGIEHCIFSAARIFTPAIGLGILSSAGVSALYATVGSIFIACFCAWNALAGRFLPPSAVADSDKKNS